MAIIVTILLISFSVSEEVFISRTFDVLDDKLNAIDMHAKINYNEIKEIENWWQDKRTLLELSLPHTPLNEVDGTFGELLGALLAEDEPTAIEQLDRLKNTSEALAEMFDYRIGNIL